MICPKSLVANATWLGLCSFALFFSHSTCSADVTVTASGANTFTTNEFFTIAGPAMPNGVSLREIRIDLQGGSDPNDFWDANQLGGNSPWGFRNGTLASTDVTFNPANGSPTVTSVMEILIADGAFTSGDWFTFDFDTDFTITDGDEFGTYGVTVEFVFSNGMTHNTAFVDDGNPDLTSLATASDAVIPESFATIWLCLFFAIVFLRSGRSKRRLQTCI